MAPSPLRRLVLFFVVVSVAVAQKVCNVIEKPNDFQNKLTWLGGAKALDDLQKATGVNNRLQKMKDSKGQPTKENLFVESYGKGSKSGSKNTTNPACKNFDDKKLYGKVTVMIYSGRNTGDGYEIPVSLTSLQRNLIDCPTKQHYECNANMFYYLARVPLYDEVREGKKPPSTTDKPEDEAIKTMECFKTQMFISAKSGPTTKVFASKQERCDALKREIKGLDCEVIDDKKHIFEKNVKPFAREVYTVQLKIGDPTEKFVELVRAIFKVYCTKDDKGLEELKPNECPSIALIDKYINMYQKDRRVEISKAKELLGLHTIAVTVSPWKITDKGKHKPRKRMKIMTVSGMNPKDCASIQMNLRFFDALMKNKYKAWPKENSFTFVFLANTGGYTINRKYNKEFTKTADGYVFDKPTKCTGVHMNHNFGPESVWKPNPNNDKNVLDPCSNVYRGAEMNSAKATKNLNMFLGTMWPDLLIAIDDSGKPDTWMKSPMFARTSTIDDIEFYNGMAKHGAMKSLVKYISQPGTSEYKQGGHIVDHYYVYTHRRPRTSKRAIALDLGSSITPEKFADIIKLTADYENKHPDD